MIAVAGHAVPHVNPREVGGHGLQGLERRLPQERDVAEVYDQAEVGVLQGDPLAQFRGQPGRTDEHSPVEVAVERLEPDLQTQRFSGRYVAGERFADVVTMRNLDDDIKVTPRIVMEG